MEMELSEGSTTLCQEDSKMESKPTDSQLEESIPVSQEAEDEKCTERSNDPGIHTELTHSDAIVSSDKSTPVDADLIVADTSASDDIEEILIESDEETPTKQRECCIKTPQSKRSVEIIDLDSDSEDVPALPLPKFQQSILERRKRPSTNLNLQNLHIIKSNRISSTATTLPALTSIVPQAGVSLGQPIVLVGPPAIGGQSANVLVSTGVSTASLQVQPSGSQHQRILPRCTSKMAEEPARKVIILQNSPIIQKPNLTPKDLAVLIMPTPDWNVNMYTEVLTISETILCQNNFEIIRKSISISSKNWVMKFSVYGFEVEEFSVGTAVASVAEIQQILNRFSTVSICSGLDFTTFKHKSFQKNLLRVKHTIYRHVDKNHRYYQCPLVIISKSAHPMEIKSSQKRAPKFQLCNKCSNVKRILDSRDPIAILDAGANRSLQID